MSTQDRIKVLARIRPLSSKEVSRDDGGGIHSVTGGQCIQLEHSGGASSGRRFVLDAVLDEDSSQEEVFSRMQPLLETSIEGYNTTIFTYGQTGTGKTFTMLGYDLWEMATNSSALSLADVTQDELYMGIVPRSMKWLFRRLNSSPDLSFSVSVSYVELYNDVKIIDLLDSAESGKVLDIRENKKGEIVVPGLARLAVSNVDEVLQVLWKGAQCRSVAATDMNDHSSRSHTVFMVYLVLESLCAQGVGREQRRSKICLVDLAGSEKWKSHQMASFSDTRIKELTSINRSLSALGNCIAALLKPSRAHIPYRDSKLTRLLQDSLGGNTRTLFIVTLSPAMSSLEETTSTLQFADRAMKVQVMAAPNKVSRDAAGCSSAELQKYQNEIVRLRSLLQLVLQKCGADMDISAVAKEIGNLGPASQHLQPSPRASNELDSISGDGRSLDGLDFDACVSQELVDLKEENMKILRDLSVCQEEVRRLKEEKRQLLSAIYQDDSFGLDFEYSTSGEVLSTRLVEYQRKAAIGDEAESCDGDKKDKKGLSRMQTRVLQQQREEIDRRQEQIDEAGVYQEERWQWLQQYHTWLQSQSTPLTRECKGMGEIDDDVYQRVCLMEASVLLQADELQRTKKFFIKTNSALYLQLAESTSRLDEMPELRQNDLQRIRYLESELEALKSMAAKRPEGDEDFFTTMSLSRGDGSSTVTKPSEIPMLRQSPQKGDSAIGKPPEPPLPPPLSLRNKASAASQTVPITHVEAESSTAAELDVYSKQFSPQRFLDSLRLAHLGSSGLGESFADAIKSHVGAVASRSNGISSSSIPFSPPPPPTRSRENSVESGEVMVATRRALVSPTSAFLPVIAGSGVSSSSKNAGRTKRLARNRYVSEDVLHPHPGAGHETSGSGNDGGGEVDMAAAVARADSIFSKHKGKSVSTVYEGVKSTCASDSVSVDLKEDERAEPDKYWDPYCSFETHIDYAGELAAVEDSIREYEREYNYSLSRSDGQGDIAGEAPMEGEYYAHKGEYYRSGSYEAREQEYTVDSHCCEYYSEQDGEEFHCTHEDGYGYGYSDGGAYYPIVTEGGGEYAEATAKEDYDEDYADGISAVIENVRVDVDEEFSKDYYFEEDSHAFPSDDDGFGQGLGGEEEDENGASDEDAEGVDVWRDAGGSQSSDRNDCGENQCQLDYDDDGRNGNGILCDSECRGTCIEGADEVRDDGADDLEENLEVSAAMAMADTILSKYNLDMHSRAHQKVSSADESDSLVENQPAGMTQMNEHYPPVARDSNSSREANSSSSAVPRKKGGPKKLWKICEDVSSGWPYYYNRVTGETTWDRPSNAQMELTCAHGKIITVNDQLARLQEADLLQTGDGQLQKVGTTDQCGGGSSIESSFVAHTSGPEGPAEQAPKVRSRFAEAALLHMKTWRDTDVAADRSVKNASDENSVSDGIQQQALDEQAPGPSGFDASVKVKVKKLWRIVEDKASGCNYYYNRRTGETTWTRPSDDDLTLDYA